MWNSLLYFVELIYIPKLLSGFVLGLSSILLSCVGFVKKLLIFVKSLIESSKIIARQTIIFFCHFYLLIRKVHVYKNVKIKKSLFQLQSQKVYILIKNMI